MDGLSHLSAVWTAHHDGVTASCSGGDRSSGRGGSHSNGSSSSRFLRLFSSKPMVTGTTRSPCLPSNCYKSGDALQEGFYCEVTTFLLGPIYRV